VSSARAGARALAVAGLSASASMLCLAPLPARASGFHIDEQDARATGRAGAVMASTNNASAIYYNSAGIARLSGVRVDVGTALVRPSAEFTSAVDGSETSADTRTFVLPQAFVSWRASDLFAVGIGVHSSFGLALKWPATSPGRANIRAADLKTLFITPTFALNLSRWLPGFCVGAGYDVVPASVRLDRDIPFGSDTGTVAVGGNALGLGGRVGIDYRPPSLPALAFGISYRSPVLLHFKGDADFDAAAPYRPSLPPDGGVTTDLTLPQTLSAGVRVSPVPELELELDGSWRGWSSYDRLEVVLPDDSVDNQAKDWNDSFTVRVGAEYTFDRRWSVRLGGIWDQTPVPADRLDFQVPDANRIDLSLGVGARFADRFDVDLGVLYVLPQQRSTSMEEPLEPPVKGRFDIDVWVMQLSVGIDLDTGSTPASAAPPAASPEAAPVAAR
jgi:long-chain fatty acid transport protein